MSAPVNALAIIDAERPLMAAASALTGVDTLAAHDAMRDAVAELIAALEKIDALFGEKERAKLAQWEGSGTECFDDHDWHHASAMRQVHEIASPALAGVKP